jgi:hypothetical protein
MRSRLRARAKTRTRLVCERERGREGGLSDFLPFSSMLLCFVFSLDLKGRKEARKEGKNAMSECQIIDSWERGGDRLQCLSQSDSKLPVPTPTYLAIS